MLYWTIPDVSDDTETWNYKSCPSGKQLLPNAFTLTSNYDSIRFPLVQLHPNFDAHGVRKVIEPNLVPVLSSPTTGSYKLRTNTLALTSFRSFRATYSKRQRMTGPMVKTLPHAFHIRICLLCWAVGQDAYAEWVPSALLQSQNVIVVCKKTPTPNRIEAG